MINRFIHIFERFKYWSKPSMKKLYLEQIRAFINSIVPITDHDWCLFEKRLACKEYSKNELLLQTGEVESYIYFMVEGVTRIFHFNDEVEYTLRFNFPISVFNSYASFISQTPSLVNVEALSDIVVFRMSYHDMQSLYDISRYADRVGRRMIELLYVQRELKEIQMHSKTADDYYCELFRNNDILVQQIPQKHIASYLGITPESLSRIKRNMTKGSCA